MYPDVRVQSSMNLEGGKMLQMQNQEPGMEFSIHSSYPTNPNRILYSKNPKAKKLKNHPFDRQSRSSFMSNGTLDQFKFDQVSRHSSIISNKSCGSKSSKFYKLKKEGRMNLLEQKNMFVGRRHTANESLVTVNHQSVPNHLNLGVNMMSGNPQQDKHEGNPMNMSNINNVNVSFQFNIQPSSSENPTNKVDETQLQNLMASTLGLLTNLQHVNQYQTDTSKLPAHPQHQSSPRKPTNTVKRTNISNLNDNRVCQSARGVSRTSASVLKAKATKINAKNKVTPGDCWSRNQEGSLRRQATDEFANEMKQEVKPSEESQFSY